MAGGFVAGRKFSTDSEYHAAIEDEKLITNLKKNTDMSDPASVARLYSALQSGEIQFKTIIGRDFDDNLYELMEKFKKQKENASDSADNKKSGKRPFLNKSVKNSKNAVKNKTVSVKNKNPDKQNNDAAIDAAAKEILRKQAIRRRCVIVIASVIAVGCLGYFAVYTKEAMEAQAAYDALASLKGTAPITEEIEQKPLFTLAKEEEPPEILDEYKNIYLKNKSIVGWLTIDDTNIDYPVMQTVDNEYYLKHNFEGKDDNNGALFADAWCNIPFRSTNIIIYGHHMKSGKMFGQLKKYADEDYCKKHNIIKFDTIYEKGEYEVMYVFRDNIRDGEDVSFKYYQFIDASSEEEYKSNLNYMSEMSLFDTGVTAEYGTDLLTLSTCNGTTNTERFVVVAKRIS